MTPHMQPAAAKGSSSKKVYGRKYGIGDHEQGNFSIELWKKAFKDACQRLCPARAGGHECGCLPVLARLVCLSHHNFLAQYTMLSFKITRKLLKQ